MIPDPEQLAADAYTAYCEAVGGYAFNGDPLPTWAQFKEDPRKEKQVGGWLAVGDLIAERLARG